MGSTVVRSRRTLMSALLLHNPRFQIVGLWSWVHVVRSCPLSFFITHDFKSWVCGRGFNGHRLRSCVHVVRSCPLSSFFITHDFKSWVQRSWVQRSWVQRSWVQRSWVQRSSVRVMGTNHGLPTNHIPPINTNDRSICRFNITIF